VGFNYFYQPKFLESKLAQICGSINQSWMDVHDHMLQPPAPKRLPKKYRAPEDLAAAGSTQPMTQLTQPTPVPVSKGSFSSEVTLVVDNREISGKGRGKTELKKLLDKIPPHELIFKNRKKVRQIMTLYSFSRDHLTFQISQKRQNCQP
jgi:hypothetical protein